MTTPLSPSTDSTEYQRLRSELTRLRAEPTPDMAAIDRVVASLAEEQLRLKAMDGQPGNNPIPDRWD